MSILLLLFNTYIGSCLGKIFFFFIKFDTENNFRKKVAAIENSRQLFFLYILIPFSSFFTNEKIVNKSLFRISELFSMFVYTLLGFSLGNIYDSMNPSIFEVALHFSIFFASLTSLTYLAVHDVLYLNIPVPFTIKMFFFAVMIHFLVIILRSLNIIESDIFENLGNLANIAGFLTLYALTYLLIIITKEQGIGAGDADINGFVGLMLGIIPGVVFIFVTIFVGAFVGVIYSLIIRKFKGVLIPMVPLIAIGYVISIGYSSRIIDFLFLN